MTSKKTIASLLKTLETQLNSLEGVDTSLQKSLSLYEKSITTSQDLIALLNRHKSKYTTLKKKAEKRGLTPGSVYQEYRKGLAAWASSGSRKGMGQHQWAMARVNSATPSKSWAVVKKSKAKKKKKK